LRYPYFPVIDDSPYEGVVPLPHPGDDVGGRPRAIPRIMLNCKYMQ
jgi:hypothetical protein